MALESTDPALRVWAIVQAAERGDESAVPLLVDRLEDEDEGVRFYAILALDRLTGTRLGYRYGASEGERCTSVDRWRRFLAESRRGGPASAVLE
ncbi:MAG: HEAT repeat domain-containing protein [Planctomycetota bacterium]